jgi:ATP-dependent Zn protease
MSNGQNQRRTPPPSGPRNQPGKKPPLPKYRRSPLSWLIIAIIIFTAMMLLQQGFKSNTISWTDFEKHLRSDDIKSMKIAETEITGKFRTPVGAGDGKGATSFTVNYHGDAAIERIYQILVEYGIEVEFAQEHSWLLLLIQWVLPLLLLAGFFYFIFARNLLRGIGGKQAGPENRTTHENDVVATADAGPRGV